MYMAMTGSTAPFMVIETDILSNGIPEKRIYKDQNIPPPIALLYLHVFYAVNGHTRHPHITADPFMVRVVTTMSWQVKGHTESLLSSLQILSVKGVALLHSAKPRILCLIICEITQDYAVVLPV
jgi:hypothetical protein